jgi:hypothetical protein
MRINYSKSSNFYHYKYLNGIFREENVMPQLPSGLRIGIRCLEPDLIIRKVSDTYPKVKLLTLGMKVKEINTVEAIKPFITVLLLREVDNAEKQVLDSRSQSIPEGMEAYDSGFTLADQETFTAGWPKDDIDAFNNFLASDKTASYFRDVLAQMQTTGTQYQENLFNLMNEVCGETDDAENLVPHWDDYDLLVALCIFADMVKPEETAQLDLWYRMNAMRRHWEEWVPELSKVTKDTAASMLEIAKALRDKSALSCRQVDRLEWLHGQNVVFANDLFDFYEPDVLNAINREAYGIIKSVTLSEPTR